MSIKAMNWVWEASRSVGNDRLVLLAIADRASDEGFDAWPSVRTLARKTRLHERTVQRCVRNVEALGELEVRRADGPRGTNVFIVRMDALALTDSRPRRSGGKKSPGGKLPPATRGDSSATPPVATAPPPGDSSATPPVATAPPDSSLTSFTSRSEQRATPSAARLTLAKDPNDNGNYRVLARLGGELARRGFWEHRGERFTITTEAELLQAVKDEAARLRIDYSGDVPHRACASEWLKHTHPELLEKAAL